MHVTGCLNLEVAAILVRKLILVSLLSPINCKFFQGKDTAFVKVNRKPYATFWLVQKFSIFSDLERLNCTKSELPNISLISEDYTRSVILAVASWNGIYNFCLWIILNFSLSRIVLEISVMTFWKLSCLYADWGGGVRVQILKKKSGWLSFVVTLHSTSLRRIAK